MRMKRIQEERMRKGGDNVDAKDRNDSTALKYMHGQSRAKGAMKNPET